KRVLTRARKPCPSARGNPTSVSRATGAPLFAAPKRGEPQDRRSDSDVPRSARIATACGGARRAPRAERRRSRGEASYRGHVLVGQQPDSPPHAVSHARVKHPCHQRGDRKLAAE